MSLVPAAAEKSTKNAAEKTHNRGRGTEDKGRITELLSSVSCILMHFCTAALDVDNPDLVYYISARIGFSFVIAVGWALAHAVRYLVTPGREGGLKNGGHNKFTNSSDNFIPLCCLHGQRSGPGCRR